MGLVRQQRGFTLVEMLIVVVILGILATVVLAAVSNATRSARRVTAEESVRQARVGIEAYRLYTGRIPNLIANWDPLTRQTVVDGKTVGPFLQGPPVNPLADGNPSCITDGNAPVLYTNHCSFLYDYAGGNGSGKFIASFDPGP